MLGDTCKESKYPSVTKTFSVGFNHDISSKRIKQFNWQIKFYSQNSTTRLFNYLKSLNGMVVSMEAYPYAKNQYYNSIPFDILQIYIGNYFWHTLKCLTTPIWMEWMKQIYFCIPNNMQKINLISKFILKISLTRRSESLWACLTVPT